MKKAQVTAFVIIGIVIVGLVVTSFAFKDQIVEQAGKMEITKGLTMSKEAQKVQLETQQCVSQLTELGLIVMGLQGGYSMIDERVQHTETQTVFEQVPYRGTAYVYFKGQNLMPTKELMEKQLAFFVTGTMPACQNTYEDVEVTYGNPITTATVLDDAIKLNVNMDVKVKKGEAESGFKTVTVNLPVRLGKIQKVSNEIVKKQIAVSNDEVCVSCIARIAAENDMEVGISKIGDDVFYSLVDKKSKVIGYDYNFMLANKF